MGVIRLLFSYNFWLFPKIISLLTSSHARAKQTLTQGGKHSTGLCAYSSLSLPFIHPSIQKLEFVPFPFLFSLLPSLPLSLSSIQQLEFRNKMVITGIRNDTLNKKEWYQTFADWKQVWCGWLLWQELALSTRLHSRHFPQMNELHL